MANSDINSTFFLGATTHLTNNAIIKITWKNNEPIWTEQWPLTKEKLQAAKELIDTQLELKHINESCFPWNSPIFVIKKKSLSRVKQITSPGWMHETSAWGSGTGKTQRDRVEREVGGGIRMGNTCKSMADSCQCMAKTTTIL